MTRRLVDFVIAATPEATRALTLEDMAVCRVWSEALGGQAKLVKSIDLWCAGPPPPPVATCGRRRQPLLRWACGFLFRTPLETPPRDAVELLDAARALAERTPDHPDSARILTLLGPHATTLQQWEKSQPSMPLDSYYAGRLTHVTAKEIAQARPRDVRLLAGIDLPHRGPVYTSPTAVRVLGDVPDEAILVVESGGCHIDGYLLGRVLAKEYIETAANIAGAAIVSKGDVRCRNIINNALVIAKLGAVHAMRAEGAKLVFAGSVLHVRESTMLGLLKARQVAVGGSVSGGDIHVVGSCTAHHFGHHKDRHLSISLRRELTCEDYGEVTGPQLTKLLSTAHRSRTQAAHYATLANLAAEEAEQTARSVLMYLYGGGDAHRVLEEMMLIQRRMQTLRRVHRNMREVRQAAEDRLMQPGAVSSWFVDDAVWDEMDTITSLEADEPIDEDLAAANEEARQFHRDILSRSLSRAQAERVLRDTSAKLRKFEQEYRDLGDEMKAKEEIVASLQSLETLAAAAGQGDRYLTVLQKLLSKMRDSGDTALAERMRGGFAAVALRNIDRRLKRAREYKQLADKALENFNGVSDQLGREFQIRVAGPGADPANTAQVTGRFAAEVWIYLDLNAGEDTAGELQRLVVTPDSGEEILTYRRFPEAEL